MNTKMMLVIYLAIAAGILFLMVLNGNKNRDYYERLDKKQHPLKVLYPAAALLYTVLHKLFHKKTNRRLVTKIKRLHVKGNVAEETFLHEVKKLALVLMVLLTASLLGALLCVAEGNKGYVEQLERNEYGKGDAVYELDMMYDGKEEDVQLSVSQQQYTEAQIREKFTAASEQVRKLMLGENSSAEHVTKPLNLISEYEGIQISWETDRTDIVDYNGQISDQVVVGERVLLNLYATFSLNEVTASYTMPVVVSVDAPGEKEALVGSIMEDIAGKNSVYEKEVQLPDEVGGKTIRFREHKEHKEYLFLLLAVVAAMLIYFGYDRKLDQDIRKRNEQMMLDFSEIVSKLSLLHEAGSSIYMAWNRIVEDYEKKEVKEHHFAYQEMKMTLEKIRSGMSEKEAYAQFGKRCGLHPYIKLGNLLEQNLSKGTKGMNLLLKQEVTDSFEERKRIARKRGEEASTKLLFPMILMLVVVIIIIAVPALMSMRM